MWRASCLCERPLRSELRRAGDRLFVAGSCRPPRSYGRPLSNALRAFNTQWPWAPQGPGMSPSRAMSGRRRGWVDARRALPLMMSFQRSTTGKLSDPLPFHSLARRGGTKGDAPDCPFARERGNLPSARPTRRTPGNPHGCWSSRSRLTVNSKIDLTANFHRELSATFLPSDLPSD